MLANNYDPIIDYLYDYIPLYANRDDIDFYVNLSDGKDVCEIGCGTGRVLMQIAKKAKSIDGIDINSVKLDMCKKKLNSKPIEIQRRVQLFNLDPVKLQAIKIYDLIILPFRVFHYVTTQSEQKALLNWIYLHLNTNGRVVIDCFNPDLKYMLNNNNKKDIEEKFLYQNKIVWRESYVKKIDFVIQNMVSVIDYNIIEDNGDRKVYTEILNWHYYYRYELEYLLEVCKFKVTNISAGYHGEKLGDVYPGELIFIAEKG